MGLLFTLSFPAPALEGKSVLWWMRRRMQRGWSLPPIETGAEAPQLAHATLDHSKVRLASSWQRPNLPPLPAEQLSPQVLQETLAAYTWLILSFILCAYWKRVVALLAFLPPLVTQDPMPLLEPTTTVCCQWVFLPSAVSLPPSCRSARFCEMPFQGLACVPNAQDSSTGLGSGSALAEVAL